MILVFVIFVSSAQLHTAFYTYQKLGAYGINDLYLNYRFSRYAINLNFEKRTTECGLKSFNCQLDSIIRDFRITAGERYWHINGPLGTILPIWGFSLSGKEMDFIVGKTKDPTTSLPPTFTQNNYTLGFKYTKYLHPGLPWELIFSRKSDASGPIHTNNYLGTNVKIKLLPRVNMNTQWATNLSEAGIGNAWTLSADFNGQRYGAGGLFRKVFNNFVTPTNHLSLPGDWLQLNSYFNPRNYLSLNQNFSYCSFADLTGSFGFSINRSPLPELGYGIGFAFKSKIVTQYLHSGFRYKGISISGDYYWSAKENRLGLKITKDFKKLQCWSQLEIKDSKVYQFGSSFFLSPNIKIKTLLGILNQNGFTKTNTGLELTLKFLQSLNLNATYELINYDHKKDHSVAVNLTNTFIFEQMGFSFISGRVFMDLNNNGFFDTTDVPMPEIEIFLDGKQSTRTDENGNYRFSFVPRGEHTVGINLGCIPAEMGTQKKGEKINTQLFSRPRVDFALGKLGLIEGIIFYDDNKNSSFDEGEKGLPNVVLGLNGFLTTSDKDGRFRFANLPPGTYVLETKVLPPETFLASSDLIYIYIKPGQEFKDFYIPVLKKERETEKKFFEEPQILKYPKPSKAMSEKKDQKMRTAEIERLFKTGVEHFVQQRYDEALKIFEQVLRLDPKHKRAQEYKRRTIARLEILKKE